MINNIITTLDLKHIDFNHSTDIESLSKYVKETFNLILPKYIVFYFSDELIEKLKKLPDGMKELSIYESKIIGGKDDSSYFELLDENHNAIVIPNYDDFDTKFKIINTNIVDLKCTKFYGYAFMARIIVNNAYTECVLNTNNFVI